MILFGLCKSPPAKFPKSAKEWAQYAKTLKIKISKQLFSAFEIQHAILRCCMGPPRDFDFDEEYPVYMANDPKAYLKCQCAEPFINFGFYYPYKSTPPLTLYTVDFVKTELKQVIGQYLISSNLFKNKNNISLPGIMENYEDDFHLEKDKNLFIDFIKNCLSEEDP